MNALLIDFYCLPYGDLFLIFTVASICFLRVRRYQDHHVWWKCLIFAAATASLLLIGLFTVSGREPGTSTLYLTPFHSYREMKATGNIEILRSNFMNGVLFYPAGLLTLSLLPKTWPRWLRAALILLIFTGISAGVEYNQYISHTGRAEIDDVIHNALGALLGALVGILP